MFTLKSLGGIFYWHLLIPFDLSCSLSLKFFVQFLSGKLIFWWIGYLSHSLLFYRDLSVSLCPVVFFLGLSVIHMHLSLLYTIDRFTLLSVLAFITSALFCYNGFSCLFPAPIDLVCSFSPFDFQPQTKIPWFSYMWILTFSVCMYANKDLWE